MDEKRGNAVWIVAALMLMLPVLYVGSYLALVHPFSGSAYYRFGGQTSAHIFWPLEQVDRKLRPGVWQTWPWLELSRPPVQAFLCPTHWEPRPTSSEEIANPLE